MNEYFVKIVNVETGEEIERPMTDEEISQREKDDIEGLAKKNNYKKQIAARQAILDRLGLTEDEAKILLG